MENPIEQRIFEEKDYNNILANLKEYGIDAKNKAYIFLDEIQAMPERRQGDKISLRPL